MLYLFSHQVVSNSFVTLWTVAGQFPMSMRFPRQEYWSGLPFLQEILHLQEILPTQGLNPHLLHWQGDPLPLSHQGSLQREESTHQI